MSITIYDTANEQQRLDGVRTARMALESGKIVCVPTDTTYALVVNAFNPGAIARLRALRLMPLHSPLGVLVPSLATLNALAAELAPEVDALVSAFWPGALGIIVPAGQSLAWDIGDSAGTVTLRMPDHPLLRDVLVDTGPLALSGAYRVGEKPLVSLPAIAKKFGSDVTVYLRGTGGKPGKTPSSVVDASLLGEPGGKLRLAREGAISLGEMQSVVPPGRWV